MADVLTAKQGDTLDELIWRERGLGAADIGRVLALNPGVADARTHDVERRGQINSTVVRVTPSMSRIA